MTAIADADVCLFMSTGAKASRGRRDRGPGVAAARASRFVLAVNKCEGRQTHSGEGEGWSPGLRRTAPISAEHRLGLEELVEALTPFAKEEEPVEEQPEEDHKPLAPRHHRAAPMWAKSSLFNRPAR